PAAAPTPGAGTAIARFLIEPQIGSRTAQRGPPKGGTNEIVVPMCTEPVGPRPGRPGDGPDRQDRIREGRLVDVGPVGDPDRRGPPDDLQGRHAENGAERAPGGEPGQR